MSTIATAAGYIAAIQYPSGRRIYARSLPMKAQFTEHQSLAHEWPDEAEARLAAIDLLKSFELRNPDALKVIIIPPAP